MVVLTPGRQSQYAMSFFNYWVGGNPTSYQQQ
jgi:hypothetical protein